MKKKEKEDKNSQRILPETLGARLFSFGKRKIAASMKMVHRVSQDKFLANRFNIIEKVVLQPRCKLDYRRISPIPLVYFRAPVLWNFEKKKEQPRPVQSTLFPSEFLKLLSVLKEELAKVSVPVSLLRTVPISPLRGENAFKGRFFATKPSSPGKDRGRFIPRVHKSRYLGALNPDLTVSGAKRSRQRPMAKTKLMQNLQFRCQTQDLMLPNPRKFLPVSPQEGGSLPWIWEITENEARVREKDERFLQERFQTDQRSVLSSEIRKLFSRWLNIRLPVVQIHHDRKMDTFLRKHHADAMTVGRDIFFRADKFDVKSARGLALLGHELTHVAQQQTNDWRNPVARRSTEYWERSARENEGLVLARAQSPNRRGRFPADLLSPLLTGGTTSFSPPLVGGVRGGGSPSITGVTGSVSTPSSFPLSAKPMFADVSRNISVPPDTSSEEIHSMTLSESELGRIKEEVYRDLMMRIKTDFERGA